MSRDKIFENEFENSDFDGQSVNWKTDASWTDDKTVTDEYDENRLMVRIDELIENSKFKKYNVLNDAGKLPKINKKDICEIYIYLTTEIKDFNIIEIFALTSEYFNISGKKFYTSLTNKHQHDLQNELSKTNSLARKLGKANLF